MKKEEFDSEKKHLSEVCEVLNNKINEMSEGIYSTDKSLQEFRRYMWENKGDMDVQELNSVRSSSEQEAKLLLDKQKYFQKLIRIQPSPYFASILYQGEDENIRKIYIGMTYLKKDEVDNYITDWRAPISSLFYDYEVGACSFEAPEGMVQGELLQKRQYKIEHQELIHLFDNSLNINDDVLQAVLAENSNEKMKNIVNTIQQEQNQVIRNVRDRNLIVQGIAGSGKTSVALHRIAFLLYKIPNLTSEKILIFSPNQIFTDYISNVLPELGEENTVQTTFHDYLHKIIREYKEVETFVHFLSKYYQNSNIDYETIKIKQSKEIISDIEAFVWDFTKKARFQHGFVENHVFEYQPATLNHLFHERYNTLPFFERIEAMALKFSENNYRGSKKKLGTYRKLLLESLGVPKDYRLLLIEFYRSEYFKGRFTKEDAKRLKSNKFITYEDALVLVYLKGLFEGFLYDKYMEQVVIDEAQDYNFLQYKILSKIFKRASFTILGDVNQNINPYYHYESLEELGELWESKYISLTKTYRSSEEIISYTNHILGLSHVSAIRKENKEPVVIHSLCDMDSDVSWLQEKYKNLAIITKNEETSSRVYELLKDKYPVSLVSFDTKEFNKDLLILPAYLAKGLEFDSVIVYQDQESYYTKEDDHLFYVACTRAQHKLVVYEALSIN